MPIRDARSALERAGSFCSFRPRCSPTWPASGLASCDDARGDDGASGPLALSRRGRVSSEVCAHVSAWALAPRRGCGYDTHQSRRGVALRQLTLRRWVGDEGHSWARALRSTRERTHGLHMRSPWPLRQGMWGVPLDASGGGTLWRGSNRAGARRPPELALEPSPRTPGAPDLAPDAF